ncbi:MarR family transcriptional regulator [Novosphingobium soli]|uniref:MarR family transcriptional regulator n=1 Tax=Novosphingobium soli TaxID=574956 RepID=A0ABV6CQ15_9SPHN
MDLDLSPTSRRTVRAFARAAETRTLEERLLVEGARQLLQARKKIASLAPKGLFRDPAWDMMLELFISGEEGGILYVKQIMIASGESTAAAMRRIDRLHEADFIERIQDPLDHRRVIVRLTERGRQAMVTMLKHAFEPGAGRAGAPVPYTPR